jgi:hypothetical protein
MGAMMVGKAIEGEPESEEDDDPQYGGRPQTSWDNDEFTTGFDKSPSGTNSSMPLPAGRFSSSVAAYEEERKKNAPTGLMDAGIKRFRKPSLYS